MSGNDSLSTSQKKAIVALLTTRDIASVARQAGVSERTVYRWQQEPDFQLALRDAEGEAITSAVRRLVGAADSAVTVLLAIMLQQQNSASVRLRAALGLFDQLIKLRELNDLELRVTELEKQEAERRIH